MGMSLPTMARRADLAMRFCACLISTLFRPPSCGMPRRAISDAAGSFSGACLRSGSSPIAAATSAVPDEPMSVTSTRLRRRSSSSMSMPRSDADARVYQAAISRNTTDSSATAPRPVTKPTPGMTAALPAAPPEPVTRARKWSSMRSWICAGVSCGLRAWSWRT